MTYYAWDRKTDKVTPCTLDEMCEAAGSFAKRRRVKMTEVGDYHVSTVFLGLNHRYDGPDGHFFETMVFDATVGDDGLKADYGQWRYDTAEQARKGHQDVVNQLMTGTKAEDLR
jgi:hypothetical protein